MAPVRATGAFFVVGDGILPRRRWVVRWPAALIGLALAIGLLWMQRPALSYLFSADEPLSLGDENGYRLERLTSNRYAEIHGIPTATGAFSRRGERAQVVVGLQNTPVLIRRDALPTEEWPARRPPPAPDSRPLGARGRLLAAEDAPPQYRGAFEMLGGRWILLDGERPGADRSTAALGVALLAFAGLNLWWLARDVARRIQARRSTAAAAPPR